MPLIGSSKYVFTTIAAVALLTLTACSGEEQAGSGAAQPLPESIFLATAPEGIQSIPELKSTAQEGDEVVVRVVVGGSVDPIVAGRASAGIMDAGIKNPCTAEDDHCTTPWDYCCMPQEDKTANLATLQITDADGKVLKADLAPRIKPLSVLVIKGIVGPRPDDQVLTIDAQGIYIEDGV